jgi:hypothetical protein
MINKIVTRGFGPIRNGVPGRAGPITRGYGGRFVEQIVEVITRRFIPGGKSRKYDDFDSIAVYAKLVDVNGFQPSKKIEGTITVKVRHRYISSLVEHISSKVKDYIVSAARLKKG